VLAAVVTEEAVAGLAARIGQGDEGDGVVVKGTDRLLVEQVDFKFCIRSCNPTLLERADED